MNFVKITGKLFLTFFCLCFLYGCAGSAVPADEPGTVQDIQPGEQSVIQPPSQQSQPAGIEERSL